MGINTLYGFRTRKTMSDPRIWDLANRAGGRALMWAGGLIMLGSPSLLLIESEDVQVLVTLPVLAAWATVGVVEHGNSAVLVTVAGGCEDPPRGSSRPYDRSFEVEDPSEGSSASRAG